jgi:glycosyltransferase involved in cell wall biosynthesis
LDQALEFYNAIDAMIVTSRYEAGWPIVILEALACNLPIISSVTLGTKDIHESGLSHCWTTNMENVEGFTHAIEQWLSDTACPHPCNHREIALQRFSPEKCFGGVLDLYLTKGRF